MPPLDPVVERWLAVAGWSAVVVFWHTTIAGLALVTWRLWRPGAAAIAQYRAGIVALLAAVFLTLLTPLSLVSAGAYRSVGATNPGPLSASESKAPSVAAAIPIVTMSAAPDARRIATVGGAAWAVGTLVALVRLGGGWVLAGWIRRRATPVSSGVLADTVADVGRTWRLPPAALLASAHVEAPVVVGHLSPAILLPYDAAHRIDARAMAPLIAHELAHVARRDYAANIAQSLAEAFLFFSPGVHWISRRVRDAREYCCDDLVVAHCGSRPYVDALTTLARLGAVPRARPVLNVAGPRLIVRIRRLLDGDAMTSFAVSRFALSAVSVVLAIAAGQSVVPLSAAAVAQATRAAVSGPPEENVVAPSFVPVQPGSPVVLESVVASGDGVCGTATVHNKADVAVTSMRFIAAVQRYAPRPSGSMEVAAAVPIDIAPDATADVGINLVSMIEEKILSRGSHAPTVMCALLELQFANGAAWRMASNGSGITIDDVLGLPRPQVPRALIGAPPASGSRDACVDESGGTYSQGAIVEVRREPGRFARCMAGAWTDHMIPGMPGGAGR